MNGATAISPSIVGHAEIALMMSSGAGGQDFQQDLEAVRGAAKRAIKMTHEIVEFAREGSVPLERVTTDFPAFVAGVAREHRERLAAVGVEVVSAPYERPISLDIDQDRVRRVLDNLISNARDALLSQRERTEEPRIFVQVRDEGDGVVVRVADNGPGVPESLRASLFRPFASRKRGGTGLGLSIVRNVVSAHGGSVDLELDPPEGGAAFVVRFPKRPSWPVLAQVGQAEQSAGTLRAI